MEVILNRGARGSPSLPFPPVSSVVEWLPLERHPVFNRKTETGAAPRLDDAAAAAFTDVSGGWNLAAWDSSSSRLYVWNSQDGCLHRLSVRLRTPDGHASVEAATPSEVRPPPPPPPLDSDSFFCFSLADVSVICAVTLFSYSKNLSIYRR